MGPTATGKTALAIELAQRLPFDVISVDSAMVYRGMDIGTGKPSARELALVPHQLIDICDPKDPYSCAEFCIDAHHAMQKSWDNGRIPLLVGGTMLYFKALQYGISELPSADIILRTELLKEADSNGWAYMHAKLAALDPHAATKLNANDSQRIQRALEINLLTGKTLQENFQKQQSLLDCDLHLFAIMPSDRAMLHRTIEKRFDQMLQAGLIDEVQRLYSRKDLSVDLPSMRAVGYRQVWQYLENNIDYKTMREKSIAATRQLAKRQYTWLRSWSNLNVMDYPNLNLLLHKFNQ